MVEDPRLGRILEHDPRSIGNYPIRSLLTAVQIRQPRSYTWAVNLWLDQGQEGACVGFALNHELAARPRVVGGRTNETAQRDYWEIQKGDPWPGGAYSGADPHYEGTSVLSGAKYMQDLGHYLEYRWTQDEAEMAAAVAWKGPVVLGINWYEGMFEPDEDGFIHPTGRLLGGHAILAHGISVKNRKRNGKYLPDHYKLWNSWGPTWGDQGQARIARSDMARLLDENGEAMLPVRA